MIHIRADGVHKRLMEFEELREISRELLIVRDYPLDYKDKKGQDWGLDRWV